MSGNRGFFAKFDKVTGNEEADLLLDGALTEISVVDMVQLSTAN